MKSNSMAAASLLLPLVLSLRSPSEPWALSFLLWIGGLVGDLEHWTRLDSPLGGAKLRWEYADGALGRRFHLA